MKQVINSQSRRSFLKQSGALASLTFIPSTVWSNIKQQKTRTAHIGVGGMGFADLQAIANHSSVEVAALCDVDSKNLAHANKSFTSAKGFADYRRLFDKMIGEIDAVIVSTPQDLALIDARKGLNMFLKVNVPVLGLIENMSHFICPSCGERSDIFGHGGAAAEAEKLGVPFLGEVPLEMAIRATSDDGTPIVASQPSSPHAEHYQQIATKLLAQLDSAEPKAAPKIVME